MSTPSEKYRIEDHPEILFAQNNIRQFEQMMPARAQQWDRGAAMYAMRDMPRMADHVAVTTSVEPDVVEAGSAEMFGFVDTLVATIVPPHPAADVKAFTGDARFRNQAIARSALIKDDFRRAKFAQKLRKATVRACVYPRAFLKAFHVDQRNKPIRPGLRVIKPHAIYFDQTVDEWEDVRWVCEVVPRTRAEVEQAIGGKGKKKQDHPYRASAAEDLKEMYSKYPEHLAHIHELEDDTRKAALKVYNWIVTYEYYDLVSGKFYIFAKGVDEPLYEDSLPYEHLPNPYYLMTFHDNLVDVGGMGDADLVIRLIDELNNLASLQYQYAVRNLPVDVVDTGKLENPQEFLSAYEANTGVGSIIEADLRVNFPLQQVLQQMPRMPLPMDFDKAMEHIYDRIRHVLAIHPMGRGQVGNVEVATEASLADAAIKNRNQPREEVINDAIVWYADACLALRRQFMRQGDPGDPMNPPEEIPVPVTDPTGKEEVQRFTKETLGLIYEDEPYAFQVEAHPYDAMAEDDVAKLRKLETIMPYLQQLAQAGLLDARELAKALANLIHMPELVVEAPPQQPAQGDVQVPGQTPGVPNTAAMPSTEEQMAGGEVMDGSGALSGLEMAPGAPGLSPPSPEGM